MGDFDQKQLKTINALAKSIRIVSVYLLLSGSAQFVGSL